MGVVELRVYEEFLCQAHASAAMLLLVKVARLDFFGGIPPKFEH